MVLGAIRAPGTRPGPRFLSGNPPDVFWGIHNINFWVNLNDGLVANLDSLMDTPAYGQEHLKFKETFMAGSLEEGQYEGQQYFFAHHLRDQRDLV